jgi:hypothetical protein
MIQREIKMKKRWKFGTQKKSLNKRLRKNFEKLKLCQMKNEL